MKTIRVLPGENEDRFMELFKQFKYPKNTVCRLGAIFGKPYNEYDISDYDYDRFAEELEAINYIKEGDSMKLTLKQRIKKFVDEHELECVIGVISLSAFALGTIIGVEIANTGHQEEIHKAASMAMGIGGTCGMGAVINLMNDNVPEAFDTFSKYCDDNKVNFAEVFKSVPTIAEYEKLFGEVKLPSPRQL